MRRLKNTQHVVIDIHVHVHENQNCKQKEATEPTAGDANIRKLGLLKPKIDYSYTVDAKFFNDQVRNTISLAIMAVAGQVVFASTQCNWIARGAGLFLIIGSIVLLCINAMQTIQALAETFRLKVGNVGQTKTYIAALILALLLNGVFFGMMSLWLYGYSQKPDLIKKNDICMFETTKLQTK